MTVLMVILGLIGLAILRFGLPLVGIWLIDKGCCLLQNLTA